MKRIKYLILVVIGFCVFSINDVKASDILIKGNSVFRKEALTVKINFISNSSGTIYYTVNDNPSATIDELTENYGDITINETKIIDVPRNLLSPGVQYVHIIVKDDLNNCSNILTISMPKNIYYFDDFEAYNQNVYPSFFDLKHNGGNSLNQKIINSNDNNVFNASGTYSTGLDERIEIDPILNGYAVLEADILAESIPNSYYYGGLTMGADSGDTRNIMVRITPNSNVFSARNHTSSITFEINKWYHVKIIVDVENKQYDYYIDGEKANTVPVEAESYLRLMWFGIYNGDGTIQYDNIKFYTQQTNPNFYLITKGTETNGTFTIDKTSAEKNTIITITPTPEFGYRVKSVKVNNSENNVIKNESNYTFNMKEEDILVTVEFEKIEYEVTNESEQKHTIGTTEDAIFTIDADISLFSKVYLDDEELNSDFYTITEGSTIITLKQDFINNLLPGTHNLRATFTDGGEANTTFIVTLPPEDNPQTGDSIILSMILGSISLIILFSIGFYLKKKRYNQFY